MSEEEQEAKEYLELAETYVTEGREAYDRAFDLHEKTRKLFHWIFFYLIATISILVGVWGNYNGWW